MKSSIVVVLVIATSLCLSGCDASPDSENELRGPATSTSTSTSNQDQDEHEDQDQHEHEDQDEDQDEDEPEDLDEYQHEPDPTPSSHCFKPDEATYGNLDLKTDATALEMAVDLNGDGRVELLIPKRSTCRDFAACPVDVLVACEGGYEVVAELVYFLPSSVTVAPNATRGWSDLLASRAQRDDEGLWETFPVRFVWNGETYVRVEE